MTRRSQFDDTGNEDDRDEEGEEDDDGFAEDMEALRQACMPAGTNSDDLSNKNSNVGGVGSSARTGLESEESGEDDLELVRIFGRRFSMPPDSVANLYSALQSMTKDCENEDGFEILLVVVRRFAAYDKNKVDLRKMVEQFQASNIASRIETSTDSMVDGKSFLKSALVFIDAIKRNRSCQKLLRSKQTQIEARIEENKQLSKRVKIFTEIQASCSKITKKELAECSDPRIQLISAGMVSSSSMGSKIIDKNAVHRGPEENSQVAKYRMALRNHPPSLDQKKKTKNWTMAERENLAKEIRQQFQELILQFLVDKLSGLEGSAGDIDNLDKILASMKEMEISAEKIREFLPRVDWEQLASTYVVGRSGFECEARWLNWEDPLINHGPWSREEDKKLLFIVQSKGLSNWFQIASLLATNRTPFQCLKRFQRSLNACMLKSEWDSNEDARLLAAVETFGENNWQSVASALGRRTGSQCSNRWRKAINPDRQRKGTWTADEDIRLKIAVKIFGPKSWPKVAQYVPGRTHDKCRERWVNCLDPSLNLGEWTGEEDLRLEAAIKEHGHAWSKVAKQLQGRTDNACKRRWKHLFPHAFSLLQAATKLKKAALPRNFVEREKERPALGPKDFVAKPMSTSDPGPKNLKQPQKRKMKSGLEVGPEKKQDGATGNATANIRSKRRSKRLQTSSAISPCIISGTEGENFTGNHAAVTKRKKKSCSKRNCHSEPATEQSAGDRLVNCLPSQQMPADIEDDVTLPSRIRNAVQKKRRKEKSLQLPGGKDCSCSTVGSQKTVEEQLGNIHECETVSDDTTLASFLRAKRRKCQLCAETVRGALPPSHMKKPNLHREV